MDSSSYYPDKFKKVDETVSSVIEERDALRAEVERLREQQLRLERWINIYQKHIAALQAALSEEL